VDRVVAGLFSKPKHRRKRVGILGCARSTFITGSVLETGSGLELEFGSVLGLGHNSDLGLDLVFCSNSVGCDILRPDSVIGKLSLSFSGLDHGSILALAPASSSVHEHFSSASIASSSSGPVHSTLDMFGCLQVSLSSVSSPSGDLSGPQVSLSEKYAGNIEGVSVNSVVPGVAALGVRLRAKSEIPRVWSVYKQTLKYYRRAREARGKPVNKVLLLKVVEALEAPPV
jgi:hypothetical protein